MYMMIVFLKALKQFAPALVVGMVLFALFKVRESLTELEVTVRHLIDTPHENVVEHIIDDAGAVVDFFIGK